MRVQGIMFNLVEEAVIHHHGEDVWDQLLDQAGLGGAYTSLGSYPDDDAFRLLNAAANALDLSPFEALRWFGRAAIPLLAVRYPRYFVGLADSRSFVIRVKNFVHPEVGSIYPGAHVPALGFSNETDGSLVLTYSSGRKLCAMAQGLMEGAAERFGETLGFEHLRCMNDGDDTCVCRITFQSPKQA